MSAVRFAFAQARLEQRAFWRRADTAFFTIAMPLSLLLLLGTATRADELPGRSFDAITFFVPGIIAFGVIAAAYGNLAARIGAMRTTGVLKRIRTTPLPQGAFLAGCIGSAVATAVAIAATTVLLGHLVFGVTPTRHGLLALVVGLLVGVGCFATLGLALSIVVPSADAAMPIANATFIPLALVSGVFDPSMSIPAWLEAVVSVLPVAALVEAVRAGYDPDATGFASRPVVLLIGWSVVGMLVNRRWFRWTP